ASDIHIEPKNQQTVVRLRVDGDMREIFTLKNDTSLMLMSRLKAMGGMDIAERRRPQDGACETKIDGRRELDPGIDSGGRPDRLRQNHDDLQRALAGGYSDAQPDLGRRSGGISH